MTKPFNYLLAVALLVVARTADGQLVRGTVRNADSTPVPGAIVVLQRANGAPVARGYARENGFFELKAPGEGRYAIAVDRFGFEAAAGAPVDVTGLVTTIALVPQSKRLSFDGVAAAPLDCRIGIDLDGRARTLHEAVQQSLHALITVESGRQFIRQVTRFQRSLDVEGKKVLEERSVPETRVSERSFLVPGPDSIRKVGYIHGDSTYFTFESPDARILVSESFTATHCFAEAPAERTEGGRTLVGLRFEPVGTRTQTEIEGTFWVDRESGALAELEWAYRPQPANRGRFGGVQRFALSPKGSVFYLDSWSQRLPIFSARRSLEKKAELTVLYSQLRFAQGVEMVVSTMREDGGKVTKLP